MQSQRRREKNSPGLSPGEFLVLLSVEECIEASNHLALEFTSVLLHHQTLDAFAMHRYEVIANDTPVDQVRNPAVHETEKRSEKVCGLSDDEVCKRHDEISVEHRRNPRVRDSPWLAHGGRVKPLPLGLDTPGAPCASLGVPPAAATAKGKAAYKMRAPARG